MPLDIKDEDQWLPLSAICIRLAERGKRITRKGLATRANQANAPFGEVRRIGAEWPTVTARKTPRMIRPPMQLFWPRVAAVYGVPE